MNKVLMYAMLLLAFLIEIFAVVVLSGLAFDYLSDGSLAC